MSDDERLVKVRCDEVGAPFSWVEVDGSQAKTHDEMNNGEGIASAVNGGE